MSKTAVGLFERPEVAEQVVHDLDASAFPRNEIRVLGEPRGMEGDGATSTPRIDFEVGLNKELAAIGASDREANAYVRGVRRGGVLVFATGSNEAVDHAVEIMNRHDATVLDELAGGQLELASTVGQNMTPILEGSLQTGRISQPGGGARMFVW
ncbi:MAG: hypothetical protein ABSC05_25030 [Candidatus Solibacter sp.]|jgi:hypothetical protein